MLRYSDAHEQHVFELQRGENAFEFTNYVFSILYDFVVTWVVNGEIKALVLLLFLGNGC